MILLLSTGAGGLLSPVDTGYGSGEGRGVPRAYAECLTDGTHFSEEEARDGMLLAPF